MKLLSRRGSPHAMARWALALLCFIVFRDSLKRLPVCLVPGASASDASISSETIGEGLRKVQSCVAEAAGGRDVRLVAVSKFQPAEAVQAALDLGQVDFGENYVQELLDKASVLPSSTRWHFIGRLQSNKVKKLVSLPNLVAIETVDSSSLAARIASAAEAAGRGEGGIDPLNLLIQVDTSGEQTKGGVQPHEASEIASHIAACGSSVRFAGLMTIGAPGDMGAFDRLRSVRGAVATALGVPDQELGLSMGMSGDFQEAIRKGATSVRVGSRIFGARPPRRAG
ncbi:unnamed protein product [Symbiodinium natans]|uniref:Pyridoxal phosphate homeostasis protein n=1 Tax=Symbiodinium natans TaxID=878477 RepID=A0A812T5W1_9DINO|nr:unnamed protein product [Symbiodinium natans]